MTKYALLAGGALALISAIQRGAAVDEESHRVDVPATRRLHEGRPAADAVEMNLRTFVDEHADDLGIALVGSPKQRRRNTKQWSVQSLVSNGAPRRCSTAAINRACSCSSLMNKSIAA